MRGLVTIVLVVSVLPALAVGGTDAGDPEPPLADAGLDRSVPLGTSVLLDGGGSRAPDGEIADYEWTITAPDGTTVAPECPDCVRTTFDADRIGEYAVTLTVTDGRGATASDTLYVNVSAGDPPAVDLSGPSETTARSRETFTAEVETDVPLSHVVWSHDGSVVANRSIDGVRDRATIEFPATGRHRITATVVDVLGRHDADWQSVSVVDPDDGEDGGGDGDDGNDGGGDDDPPPDDGDDDGPPPDDGDDDGPTELVADAGGEYAVEAGDTEFLDGSGSEGRIVRYEWEVVSGPGSVSGGSAMPTYGAPDDAGGQTATVTLTVTGRDGSKDSDTATVEVTAPGGSEVVADAGGPYEIRANETVTLDGSGSEAIGTGIESYEWAGGGFEAEGETVTFDPPEVDAESERTVALTVTGADGSEDVDEATVTVLPTGEDGGSDDNDGGNNNAGNGRPVNAHIEGPTRVEWNGHSYTAEYALCSDYDSPQNDNRAEDRWYYAIGDHPCDGTGGPVGPLADILHYDVYQTDEGRQRVDRVKVDSGNKVTIELRGDPITAPEGPTVNEEEIRDSFESYSVQVVYESAGSRHSSSKNTNICPENYECDGEIDSGEFRIQSFVTGDNPIEYGDSTSLYAEVAEWGGMSDGEFKFKWVRDHAIRGYTDYGQRTTVSPDLSAIRRGDDTDVEYEARAVADPTHPRYDTEKELETSTITVTVEGECSEDEKWDADSEECITPDDGSGDEDGDGSEWDNIDMCEKFDLAHCGGGDGDDDNTGDDNHTDPGDDPAPPGGDNCIDPSNPACGGMSDGDDTGGGGGGTSGGDNSQPISS